MSGLVDRLRGKLRARRFTVDRFREYGYRVKEIDLGPDGQVPFAKWQHPLEVSEDFGRRHLEFARRWVRPGELVIDVGAYTGDTTVPLALAAGRRGLTLALEPNPYVFKILKANAALNASRARIEPLCFAAAETDGPLTFNYSDASFCNGGYLSKIARTDHGHEYPLQVDGRDLTAFLQAKYRRWLPKLAFVKIDAEGYDKDIIRGLRGLLLKYRPYLVTECLPSLSPAERRQLLAALKQAKYRPYRLPDFGTMPAEVVTTERLVADRDHLDIFAVPTERRLPRGTG